MKRAERGRAFTASPTTRFVWPGRLRDRIPDRWERTCGARVGYRKHN